MDFERKNKFTIKQNILFYGGVALREIRWLVFLIFICCICFFIFRELFVSLFQDMISLLTSD